jgi:hypothetical protein
LLPLGFHRAVNVLLNACSFVCSQLHTFDGACEQLPSPHQLQRKVLIKDRGARKQLSSLDRDWKTVEDADDEAAASAAVRADRVRRRQSRGFAAVIGLMYFAFL